jgi:hypothetical protein
MKLLNEYLGKLMPKFKISFLNIVAADVESKLEKIR